MKRARWDLRRSLVTLVALASLAGMVLATRRGPLANAVSGGWFPLYWLGWPIAGWMILTQRHGNRIGRLSLGVGAIMGLAFGLQAFVYDVRPAIGPWVELAYTVLGIVPWIVIVALLNTFPTGAYATRWEARLGRLLILVALWAVLGFTISPEPMYDTGRPSPLAVPGLAGLAVITNESGFFLIVLLGALALLRLFARARGSSGVEGQQYRWLLLGGLVFVLDSALGQVLPENSIATDLWVLVGGWAIPVSIGVAIVRYRLYEIDRILSRTVSYVIVVGLLAALFFVGVTALSSILPTESPLAVAGSTLAVAGSFNPVRRRVQSWVDRRFNRSRYDAVQVVERFVGSLQDKVDGPEVVDGWVGVVSETMQPASVGVWLRNGSGTMGE